MLGLMTLMLACATHHPREELVPRLERYSVRVAAEFGPTVSGEIELQAEMTTELQMVVAMEPTRRFRDGSSGRLLSVESATLTLSGEPLPLDLVGRTAELRTFPNGEILDVGWGEKLSGPDRYLDVFEIVFPALSPSPPTVDSGATARRRIIWPFKHARTLRWDNAVDAVWTNTGLKERRWRLEYEGAWAMEGKTRFVESKVTYGGRGAATGVVLMDAATGQLVSHEFDWTRTVEVSGLGSVEQKQRFHGTVGALQ